jgi:hypothetical protein
MSNKRVEHACSAGLDSQEPAAFARGSFAALEFMMRTIHVQVQPERVKHLNVAAADAALRTLPRARCWSVSFDSKKVATVVVLKGRRAKRARP